MSQVEIKGPPARAPRRRRLLWNAAGVSIALLALIGALWFCVNSHQFEEMVRRRIVSELEAATGGRVEIRSFHWRLFDLEADALAVGPRQLLRLEIDGERRVCSPLGVIHKLCKVFR